METQRMELLTKLRECKVVIFMIAEREARANQLIEDIDELEKSTISKNRKNIDKLKALLDITKEEINRYTQWLNNIITLINKLNPSEASIITDRYIHGLKIRQIAKNTNYSYQRIYQLVAKAIDNLLKIQTNSNIRND